MNVEKLLKDKSGIRLDIGGGHNPNQGFVNIDILDLPEVDIVHNIELTPWPLPDECVLTATASHLLEHINPTPPDSRLKPLIELLISKNIITQEEALNHRLLGNDGAIFLRVMNEIWRVMKPYGQFALVVPHANSPGFAQDPTHCNMINETTFHYFDPDPERKNLCGQLYGFYQPKPWKIVNQYFSYMGNIEVLLEKRPDDRTYHGIYNPEDITKEKINDEVK